MFTLLRRLPDWQANLLQATVFVSFLWELGYQAWGPLLTIPFVLVQAYIFKLRSLTYVVTVHLLFDAVVFLVLVHAHNPGLLDGCSWSDRPPRVHPSPVYAWAAFVRAQVTDERVHRGCTDRLGTLMVDLERILGRGISTR